jgi:hypothetical protein
MKKTLLIFTCLILSANIAYSPENKNEPLSIEPIPIPTALENIKNNTKFVAHITFPELKNIRGTTPSRTKQILPGKGTAISDISYYKPTVELGDSAGKAKNAIKANIPILELGDLAIITADESDPSALKAIVTVTNPRKEMLLGK